MILKHFSALRFAGGKMRYPAIAVLFFATAAHAADEPIADYSGTYICKATAAGGLAYDPGSKTWSSTTFNVNDSTYTVKVIDTGRIEEMFTLKGRVYKISVKKFGSEEKPDFCRGFSDEGFSDEVSSVGERFECRNFGYDYAFNFKSLRYLIKFEGGFVWSEDRNNHDTPYVEGGKCDKID